MQDCPCERGLERIEHEPLINHQAKRGVSHANSAFGGAYNGGRRFAFLGIFRSRRQRRGPCVEGREQQETQSREFHQVRVYGAMEVPKILSGELRTILVSTELSVMTVHFLYK